VCEACCVLVWAVHRTVYYCSGPGAGLGSGGRKWGTRLKAYGLLHIRKRISPNEVHPPDPLLPHTHESARHVAKQRLADLQVVLCAGSTHTHTHPTHFSVRHLSPFTWAPYTQHTAGGMGHLSPQSTDVQRPHRVAPVEQARPLLDPLQAPSPVPPAPSAASSVTVCCDAQGLGTMPTAARPGSRAVQTPMATCYMAHLPHQCCSR